MENKQFLSLFLFNFCVILLLGALFYKVDFIEMPVTQFIYANDQEIVTDYCYSFQSLHRVYPARMPEDIVVAMHSGTNLLIKDVTLSPVGSTGSMKPALFENYHIIIHEYTGQNLEIGDWITFNQDDHHKVHQIINVTDFGYVTKGINNLYEDPSFITEDMITYQVAGVLFRRSFV